MLYNTQSNDNYALILSNNRDNGFSYAGARVLVDYLDELSEDCGKNIEFDSVAIRCDYSEYTKEELIENYSYSAGVEKVN